MRAGPGMAPGPTSGLHLLPDRPRPVRRLPMRAVVAKFNQRTVQAVRRRLLHPDAEDTGGQRSDLEWLSTGLPARPHLIDNTLPDTQPPQRHVGDAHVLPTREYKIFHHGRMLPMRVLSKPHLVVVTHSGEELWIDFLRFESEPAQTNVEVFVIRTPLVIHLIVPACGQEGVLGYGDASGDASAHLTLAHVGPEEVTGKVAGAANGAVRDRKRVGHILVETCAGVVVRIHIHQDVRALSEGQAVGHVLGVGHPEWAGLGEAVDRESTALEGASHVRVWGGAQVLFEVIGRVVVQEHEVRERVSAQVRGEGEFNVLCSALAGGTEIDGG